MLSETGTTAVVCKMVKREKKSDDEIKYSTTIISVNEKPVTKLVSGFPSASNQNLNWYFSKNDIVFNGLLGESQNKGFTKVVGGHYNVNSVAVEDLQMWAFDGAKLISKAIRLH